MTAVLLSDDTAMGGDSISAARSNYRRQFGDSVDEPVTVHGALSVRAGRVCAVVTSPSIGADVCAAWDPPIPAAPPRFGDVVDAVIAKATAQAEAAARAAAAAAKAKRQGAQGG